MGAQAPDDDALGAVSLVDLLVRRLRAEILDGALAPGERLVEEQLTRRFGTSRAPVREALRLLGQQGLVEHLPRRGVRVVELSARDIRELFDLRDVLEQFALRTALREPGTRPPPGLTRLRAAVEAMEGLPSDAAAADQAAFHREFHLALVGLADHEHLLRTYEPILVRLQLYMATNLRREAEAGSAADGARRHRRLYEAIVTGDAELAVAALGRHGAQVYLAPELRGRSSPDGVS